MNRVRNMLPKNLELVKVYDQSTFIRQAVNEVINAGVIGGILAVLILYFFLQHFWTTVIIAMSIPVSVIATFNLMYGADLTLNIMSLGGIALGIGMLVDNSIVVLENIHRHREKGKSILEAARDGASEVGMAVTASTLTTVAVFFPLVFVKGISGQLFRDQALTVTFALFASLAVALTLIPMLASLQSKKREMALMPELKQPRTRFGRMMRKIRLFIFTKLPVLFVKIFRIIAHTIARFFQMIMKPLLNGFHKFFGAVDKRYPNLLQWSLNHKFAVLGVSLCLFIISLIMIPILGVDAVRDKEFVGKLTRISPVVDPATGTVKVTVEMHDPSRQMKPGMFARLNIIYDVRKSTMLVPKDAIMAEDKESAVYVVKDSLALRQIVETGYVNTTHIEVLSGLAPQDTVVTTGKGSLKDSSRVELVETKVVKK